MTVAAHSQEPVSDATGAQPEPVGFARSLLAGARAALVTPGVYILIFAMMGFGALARDAGFSLLEAGSITLLLFQLPGQVALVDQVARGASLPVVALAVILTAIRLLPMAVVLMPYVRGSGLPRWVEMLATHFVAITSWVEALRRLPSLPVADRLPNFVGFGSVVCLATTAATVAGYVSLGSVSPLVGGVMLFLTPIYFMSSLISTASGLADRAALLIGVLMGPALFLLLPGFDLLLTGLIGGTLAWWLDYRRRGSTGADSAKLTKT